MPLLDANHLQGNYNYFILVVSQAVIRTKYYPETLHGYWNKHVTEEYKIMLKYFKKSTSTLLKNPMQTNDRCTSAVKLCSKY